MGRKSAREKMRRKTVREEGEERVCESVSCEVAISRVHMLWIYCFTDVSERDSGGSSVLWL